MNLCRCERGHFYDKEKYSTCPHCASGGENDKGVTKAFDEQTMGGGMPPLVPRVNPQQSSQSTVPLTQQDTVERRRNGFPISNIDAAEETQAIRQGTATQAVPRNMEFPEENNHDDYNPFNPGPVTRKLEPDSDDDVTVGFFGDDFFDINKTTSAMEIRHSSGYAANKVTTPCVGWLIAISGEHLGTDFRLKVGKNFIGRSMNNDIALTNDKSVSRERHAIVVYEPKLHMYLVQPGEASTLVYMNNDVVLTPVKLQPYDMITVGEVNLLFMPLCGDRFNWGDIFEQMKNKQ